MKIDFYVSVIDNYGDMWFALNLADTLYFYDKNLEIRFFTDDIKLFTKMSKWLSANFIKVYELKDIKNFKPNTYIFNFFDRKLDSDFLTQFDYSINVITFSYFLLHTSTSLYSPSIEHLHQKTYTLWKTWNISVKYFIPSLLPNTGGVIINPKTEAKRLNKEKDIEELRKDFLKDYNIEFSSEILKKHWISLFIYDETFDEIKKSKIFDFPDYTFFIFWKDKKYKFTKNIVWLPFLPLNEYGYFLSLCDINFVRWENSLVEAILSWKPFIWDIYKEINKAHKEKISDFVAYIKQFWFSNDYFSLFEWFNKQKKTEYFQKWIHFLEKDKKSFSLLSTYVRENCDLHTIIKKDFL